MGFGHLRGIFRFAGLKSREVFSRPLKGTPIVSSSFPAVLPQQAKTGLAGDPGNGGLLPDVPLTRDWIRGSAVTVICTGGIAS
jgi:hypothetical protein